MLVWSDLTAGGQGFARIGQVSGTNISLGKTEQYSSANAPYACMAKIGENRFALAYRYGDNAGKPAVTVGTAMGNKLQFSEKKAVDSNGVSDCVTIAPLKENLFAVSYRNNDADRESPIHIGAFVNGELKLTPKFVADNGASYQHLQQVDENTLLLTHIMPGHKVQSRVFRLK